MASAKKTAKSSKVKQAKQIATAKTKPSKHSAEVKAKKAAAARALAARTRAANAAKKPGGKARSTAPSAAARRARSEATAKQVASKKNSAARVATHRGKKTAAPRSTKTARPRTTAAPRRAASKTPSSRASRPISTGIQPQVRQTSTKPVSPKERSRRVASSLPAAAGKGIAAPNRGAQKPAANKAAAAAILALKRKSPPPDKAGGHGNSAAGQAALKSSSRPNIVTSDRVNTIKNAGKSGSAPLVGGPAESAAARSHRDEGFARARVPGHLKGPGRPFAAAARNPQALLSGVSRTDPTAPVLAGQTRADKPALARESIIPVQKPARAANLPRPPFKLGEYVVYPSHGVGQIIAIEEQEVAGFTLELFVLSFVKDKMTLKVPVTKATSVGMRKLADAGAVKVALDTLSGRARIKRTMWSRRAQEYEAKINSGDLNAIAEVVRDLYRSDTQPEQSYSERQLYEAALDRMAREIVVVQKLTETESLKMIEAQLQKGPRRGKVEESEAEEADIEEAA